jgi:hypothetical protein
MSEQKTHAKIIAECYHNTAATRYVRDLLDRLDAAHKRDADALKQRCTELNAEVAAKDEVIKRLNDAIAEEQRRKLATAENSSAVGDAAKLREALEYMFILIDERHLVLECETTEEISGVQGKLAEARAVLAAPPRNCDVYDNESCRMAYHLRGDGLMTMQAFADWLFAPATEKEGGAK